MEAVILYKALIKRARDHKKKSKPSDCSNLEIMCAKSPNLKSGVSPSFQVQLQHIIPELMRLKQDCRIPAHLLFIVHVDCLISHLLLHMLVALFWI